MTRNEVITTLYNSQPFNDCINRMEPSHLRADLKNEITLILLELPEQRLLRLHAAGQLMYFAWKVVVNQVKSNTSCFCKKYRQHNVELNGYDLAAEEMNGRVGKELEEELALARVEDLYWYDRDIVRLYLRLGSYRAIEKETGIPWESCYKTVRNAVIKLRNEVAV